SLHVPEAQLPELPHGHLVRHRLAVLVDDEAGQRGPHTVHLKIPVGGHLNGLELLDRQVLDALFGDVEPDAAHSVPPYGRAASSLTISSCPAVAAVAL